MFSNRSAIALTGLFATLAALYALLSNTCDCYALNSCYDSSRVPCEVTFISGLLGDAAGRAAASDVLATFLLISGIALLTLSLLPRLDPKATWRS